MPISPVVVSTATIENVETSGSPSALTAGASARGAGHDSAMPTATAIRTAAKTKAARRSVEDVIRSGLG